VCGIAAAVGRITPEVVDAVGRMQHAQRHRGPDGDGRWISEPAGDGSGCALAHTRLAVIDLSAAGAQPMIDSVRGHVLVYNGEIYNYRRLREELAAEGATFAGQSDSEVLLQAYGRWGIECLSRLRGMFALLVWDAEQRAAFVARDRLGVKPLYWARVGDADSAVLLIASEVRALLASGLVPREIDPVGLSTYLWNGFPVGPSTIVRGVHQVPAGTWARVEPGDPLIDAQRFWQLPSARADGTTDAVEAALRESVTDRLVSDVPLGVFLSGGVDSSAVAAAATRAGSTVRTCTLGFEEPGYDESVHAQAVADALGAEHQTIRLSESAFAAQLPSALASLDQPTFDAINTYVVSRAVREAGLTVALSGLGGDELFGGYRSSRELPRMTQLARWLRPVPAPMLRTAGTAAARARLGSFGAVPPQTRWGKLADALLTRGERVRLYQTFYALFTADFLDALVPSGFGADGGTLDGLPTRRAAELAELVRGEPARHAVSLLELSCFVGERLLRDTDVVSMGVSLEVRVPLVDHELIDAVAALEETRRFDPPGRKQVLRDVALRGLDPALFERPKSGFELPLDTWCRGRLADEIGAVLGDATACRAVGLDPSAVTRLWSAFRDGAPGLYWSRVWALYVLIWWCRAHGLSLP
jgi:asparagine synthase (glutamine-hydrolysing)